MKHRAAERFPLKLPISVRWTSPSGSAEVQTRCHDVSSHGIYFDLEPIEPAPIQKGSKVEIVITLPEGASLSRVYCHGHVRRTKVLDLNRVGVAAQIERYRFLRGTDSPD